MATYPKAKSRGIDGGARILLETKCTDGEYENVWFGPKPGEWYTFTIEEAERRVKAQDWTPPKAAKEGK